MFSVATAVVLLGTLALTSAQPRPLQLGAPVLQSFPFEGRASYSATICPGTAWIVEVTPATAEDNPNLAANTLTIDFPVIDTADGGTEWDVSSADFASGQACGQVERVRVPSPASVTEVRIQVLVLLPCGGGDSLRPQTHSIRVFPDVPPASVNAVITACEPEGDVDEDGVLNVKDLCADSTRGSRDHVDANGCERDQVDADLDGWCNPDRAKSPSGAWLPTNPLWCTGEDNCKFVPNEKQQATATNVHGDACSLEGCHPACRIGCDHEAAGVPHRGDIGACTQRSSGASQQLLKCERCDIAAGFRPVKDADFGCEVGHADMCLQPSPSPSPTPQAANEPYGCIVGSTLIETQGRGTLPAADVRVGDVIRGVRSVGSSPEPAAAWCRVLSVEDHGEAAATMEFTPNHLVAREASADGGETLRIEEYGSGAVVLLPRPAITDGDVPAVSQLKMLNIVTECELAATASGQLFTPLTSGSCLSSLSWSQYATVFRIATRVMAATGRFWLHSSQGSVQPEGGWDDPRPRVCPALLECITADDDDVASGACDALEAAAAAWVNGGVMDDAQRAAVLSAFPDLGDATADGSLTNTVVRPTPVTRRRLRV